jgi:hypothetical protein
MTKKTKEKYKEYIYKAYKNYAKRFCVCQLSWGKSLAVCLSQSCPS